MFDSAERYAAVFDGCGDEFRNFSWVGAVTTAVWVTFMIIFFFDNLVKKKMYHHIIGRLGGSSDVQLRRPAGLGNIVISFAHNTRNGSAEENAGEGKHQIK